MRTSGAFRTYRQAGSVLLPVMLLGAAVWVYAGYAAYHLLKH